MIAVLVHPWESLLSTYTYKILSYFLSKLFRVGYPFYCQYINFLMSWHTWLLRADVHQKYWVWLQVIKQYIDHFLKIDLDLAMQILFVWRNF